jgi:hypothetical protein
MRDELRPARRFAAAGGLVAAAFGVPLFLDPYRWARTFGWRAEEETDVGLYFGRCLGAMALATSVHGALAARDPRRHASFFAFAEAVGWLVAAAHVRGLVERRQPPIEDVEIVGWVALAAGARRWAPRRR